jgi:thiol-disulfide isomerase/thioredoxin
MAWVRLALAVVCAGVALAGCGARSAPPGGPPVSTQVAVSAQAGLPSERTARAVKVPEQLRFSAKTLDGKDFSGATLAGKPAVVWFWAPWCPRCQGEAEDIAAAAKETAGRVAFLGVAALDEVPAMRKFVREYDLGSFPHLADTDAAVWKRFGVVEQPAHAFITAAGEVEMVLKQLPTNELLDRVRALAG